MHLKPFGNIVVSFCLGCLAPSLALAQPVITAQPGNQFVAPGAAATFTVSVTGAAPLTYQWLFDGAKIAGAAARGLAVANPQPAQWGYYSVIVSDASGSVTSQVAELKTFVAAPHNLSGIQAAAGGVMSLTFTGDVRAVLGPYYDLYPLETSSNLVDWAPLATLQRTNTALDALQFLDADAPQFSRRFYRTPTNQLATPDPQPTGPYPVGTFSMLLSEPSGTNAAGTTNYHQFMSTFWYPAAAQAGLLPAKYVEPQVAQDESYGSFTAAVEAFFSHSQPNAPLATNLAKYPVVLYDPSWGDHRRENTDKAEDLASWGYIVVALDASDTAVSVFPNGAVLPGQAVVNTTAGIEAAIEGRLLDLQFVLDELESLDAGDPRLGGRLDLDKIGVVGFSMGGSTAAQLCLRDPRCKAGAAMDWSFIETNLLAQPLGVPWLYFRSDDSPDPDPGAMLPDGLPDDRLEVYNQQVTNAYWVKLVSTIHYSFNDYGLIVDSATLADLVGRATMSGHYLPPARVSQIVRAYLLSFFNKFLLGEDDHLLDGPSSAYPEVMQFLSKSNASAPPEYPSAALVQGSDGNLYGTTAYGGASGGGTVFRVATNGALTTLISFNGTNGSHPVAALVQGSDGNFYGTTARGGVSGGGTVFQMKTNGALTTLISFDGPNGSHPSAALVQGSDGNFYGTTLLGGASANGGTVFQMSAAGALTTLVSLSGHNGISPFAGLVQGTNGNFYGTTAGGGASGLGTVFDVTPAGGLRALSQFDASNGGNPPAALVQGSDGNFYGTTPYGGNLNLNVGAGYGTVFRMKPNGVLTPLVLFDGANGNCPAAGLVQGNDGNFYGTTAGGGAGGLGTVFKMTSAGVLTTLASFTGANGNSPQAALAQGTDGNFYGTTTYGGAGGLGTVFQVTPSGVLTMLVSFGAN